MNFVVYIECSLGLVFLILDKIFPSFTKAIDTSDSDVSMNKLIILWPHIYLHIFPHVVLILIYY